MDTPPPPPPRFSSPPPTPPPLPPEPPAYVRPPEPGGSKSRVALIAVVVTVLAAGASWLWNQKFGQKAKFQAESAEDRAAGLRAAFHGTGQPVSLTSPEALAIDGVFRRMLKAYEKKDIAGLAACFDFAGVMEMAADQNPSTELKSAARQARRDPNVARQGALASMKGLIQNSDHQSYAIRRLDIDAAGTQAMALVIWKNADGTRSKERYWFIRTPDWRACDYEELDTSIRMSTMVAAAANDPIAMKSGQSAVADFQKLITAITEGEPDKARQLLVKVRKSVLSKLYADVTDMLEVGVFAQEEKPDEALAAADRLQKRRPDMPVIYYQRATILSDMERYADSIAAAKQYLEILGDDPEMLNLMASCHLALKEPDKARECALRVLLEVPPDEEALVYFGRTMRPEDAAKFEELLGESENTEGTIQSIASDLEDDPAGPPALEILTIVAEKAAPKAGITTSLKTGRRARELWKKVAAAGAGGDDMLVSALKEGSEEEAEALGEALRHSLSTAQDAGGLERLSAAGDTARPDTSEPMLAKAVATAIRLRPDIEKTSDPDKALLEALKAAALPGFVAWNLAMAWQDADKPELAKKAAAALKQVAPDDEMNEQMAAFFGDEPEPATTPEEPK